MDNDDTFNSQLEESFDEKVKIMIIGETKTGKTSLISRYCKNEFIGGAYLSTIGIDFQVKILNFNKKKIKVQIWDTAGQERYRNIAKNYFQSSDGFLLVYDISSKDSFDKLDFWKDQIKSNAPENAKLIIVGNKCDLEGNRQVKKEEGQHFADSNKVPFYETSAKTSMNVKTVFELLAKIIVNDEKTVVNKKRASQVLKKKKTEKQKKSCC